MRCLDSITDSMVMNLSKLWEIAKDRDRGGWHAAVLGVTKSQITTELWNNNKNISKHKMSLEEHVLIYVCPGF